jgi:hypothetical protein
MCFISIRRKVDSSLDVHKIVLTIGSTFLFTDGSIIVVLINDLRIWLRVKSEEKTCRSLPVINE